jgi:putative aldouronate transport system permease protein
MANSGVADSQGEAFRRLMKYSTVIISIVPIMMVYPFIQKYFTKGMMIGALKG